jgi:hypothetical protein
LEKNQEELTQTIKQIKEVINKKQIDLYQHTTEALVNSKWEKNAKAYKTILIKKNSWQRLRAWLH